MHLNTHKERDWHCMKSLCASLLITPNASGLPLAPQIWCAHAPLLFRYVDGIDPAVQLPVGVDAALAALLQLVEPPEQRGLGEAHPMHTHMKQARCAPVCGCPSGGAASLWVPRGPTSAPVSPCHPALRFGSH